MLQVYQAGPLFTEGEQDWHRKAKAAMEAACAAAGTPVRIVWPGEFFSQKEIDAWGPRAKHHIFERCMEDLLKSNIVVALLDGVMVDDGTAFEMGAFHALKLGPILGVRTDFRNAGDTCNSAVNVMLECSCASIHRSIEDVAAALVATVRAR